MEAGVSSGRFLDEIRFGWRGSMVGSALGCVANHFDVVPVRTNDERCVVVRVVVRAQARRTIVFPARLQRRTMESFDLPAILGHERQVKMRGLLVGLVRAQGEGRPGKAKNPPHLDLRF